MQTGDFKRLIWGHYRAHGRHGLAWRRTRDPYRILVSEIMLQQTQVARAAKFYPRFLKRFPDFRSLARARTAAVLRVWQGMGYNRRALALQKLARIVLEKYDGRLPRERAALIALPGVGAATAGTVRAFAWNEPDVFIETNIRRAFIHSFFMKRPRRRAVTDEELARYIKCTLDRKNPREWYWALMDYGAWLGGGANPNRKSARYMRQPPFAGSDRELRGRIVRILLRVKHLSFSALAKETKKPYKRTKGVVMALVREGLIKRQGDIISI